MNKKEKIITTLTILFFITTIIFGVLFVDAKLNSSSANNSKECTTEKTENKPEELTGEVINVSPNANLLEAIESNSDINIKIDDETILDLIFDYGTIGNKKFKIKFEREAANEEGDNEEKVTLVIDDKTYEYWSGRNHKIGANGISQLLESLKVVEFENNIVLINYQKGTVQPQDREFSYASIDAYNETGLVYSIQNIITNCFVKDETNNKIEEHPYSPYVLEVELPITVANGKITYYTIEEAFPEESVNKVTKKEISNGKEKAIETFEAFVTEAA